MQKVFATLQLSAIRTTTTVEVSLALLICGANLVDRHLAVVHLSIPKAGCNTRWRRDDPFWIVIGYHLARQLAVLALFECSRAAVRLVRSKIKSPEPYAGERSPSPIGLGHNRALTIHLHESCGTWIAHDIIDTTERHLCEYQRR